MISQFVRAALILFTTCAMFVVSLPAIAQSEASPSPTDQPPPSSPPWNVSITPYIWAPSINGTLTLQHPRLDVPSEAATLGIHVGPNKYLNKLNFAAMFTLDANNGRYDLFGDVVDLIVSSRTSGVSTVTTPEGRVEVPVNVDASTRLSAGLLTFGFGYIFYNHGKSNFEGFAGTRIANIRPSVTWNFAAPLDILEKSGTASRNVTLWSPIFGFRGKLGLGGHFFIPYYGDFGWGNAFMTYQGYAGFGYGFNHGQAIVLVNRWLGYQMDNGPLNYLQLVGPTLAYKIPL